MEMILISSGFRTKTEAAIWVNRQTQLKRHGAKIKIVMRKYDDKYTSLNCILDLDIKLTTLI